MNAINTAVISAQATIDKLLSNGNASAASGLTKGEVWDVWTYAEPFSGPEIGVNYWRCDNDWTYRATNNAADSTFFSKAGRAKTLREARLDALYALVAGCSAQAEKTENSVKEELLNLMQNEDHQAAVKDVINSGLMPRQLLRRWIDTTEWRAIQRGEGQDVSPEWRQWAYWRLTGKIKTAEKGGQWQEEFLWRTVEAAGRAAWNSTESLPCSERADAWKAAEVAEREQQYNDLLAIINEM